MVDSRARLKDSETSAKTRAAHSLSAKDGAAPPYDDRKSYSPSNDGAPRCRIRQSNLVRDSSSAIRRPHFAKRSAASLFGRVLQWLAEPGLRMGQIEGYHGPAGTRPAAARNVPPHFCHGSRGWQQDNGRRFPSAVCSRLSSVCAAPSFGVDDRKAIPRPSIELPASPHSPHPIARLVVCSPLFKEERYASSPRLIAH